MDHLVHPENSLMRWFLMVGTKAQRNLTKDTCPARMSAYDFMTAALPPHEAVRICSHHDASLSVPMSL